MSGACCKHGSDEKCIQNLVGKSEGRHYLEDLDIDGRIILTFIFSN
jgi:hypothetical protein